MIREWEVLARPVYSVILVGYIARQFQMLLLVLSDWYVCSSWVMLDCQPECKLLAHLYSRISAACNTG